jgi:hypothetical protein
MEIAADGSARIEHVTFNDSGCEPYDRACEAELGARVVDLGTCRLEIDDATSTLITREPAP